MSRSSNLYDLQLIDNKLDQHRKQLNEIAAIMADDSDVKSAESSLESAKEVLDEIEKCLRQAENKVREQRLKIKITDTKLYGGKINNPKELQDLQNESEALKRYLNVLEDQQLEYMLKFDEASERYNYANDILDNILSNMKSMHAELIVEKTRIESEIDGSNAQREITAKLISEEDLDIYERLRGQGYGLAVSKVNDKACSACGATLTAALYQVARSPNTLTRCETCGRILFS